MTRLLGRALGFEHLEDRMMLTGEPVFLTSASTIVPENQTAALVISAQSSQGVPINQFSLVGGADQAKFTLNAATGALSFLVAPDYEAPTDADLNNSYLVSVRAQDGAGGFAVQALTVFVGNVANEGQGGSNSPPDILSGDVTMNEGVLFVLYLWATDPDGDPITFSMNGGADSSKFQIQQGNQLFMTNAPDFEAPADANADNVYEVQVQASDGRGGTDSKLLQVTVVNRAESPEFKSPVNEPFPDAYAWPVGMGSDKGTEIGTVHAVDPDGDTVTYAITGGNSDGYFKIDASSGLISAAKDLPVQAAPFILYVRASDGTTMPPDSATVTITPKQMVVLTGDFHGVEVLPGTGGTDTITLTFIRYTHDVNQALNVTVDVTWTSADWFDFDNTDPVNKISNFIAQGATQTTVPFAAGEQQKSFTFVPLQNGDALARESFNVSIVVNQSSPYVTYTQSDRQELKSKKPGFQGADDATVFVLDSITLFGGNNDVPALADPVGEVDLNDVMQGAVNDCFYHAAIGAVALREPGFIESLFDENPDGTVTVRFFKNDGSAAIDITVPISLDRGWSQADLSGDYDELLAFEVWPIILEKAYAEFLEEAGIASDGWTDMNDGGSSSEVWGHLYNNNYTVLSPTSSGIEALVLARANSEKLVIGTKENGTDNKKGLWQLSNGGTLSGWHAYIVLGTYDNRTPANPNADYGVILYNPWGPSWNTTPIYLPFSDFETVVSGIYTRP